MRLRGVLAAVLVTLSGCAASGGSPSLGSSGLAGAVPGGDGRQALVYRAEYRGAVTRAADSLLRVIHQAWRRDDAEALAKVYGRDAMLVTAAGALIHGEDPVRRFVVSRLHGSGALRLWRDDLVASGEMAFIQGRYQAYGPGPVATHRGLHFTIASRRGRDWKVRAQAFFPLEGSPLAVPPDFFTDDPVPVTAEAVREKRSGGDPVQARSSLAQWAVGTYWETNSAMSSLRFAWTRDDLPALMELLEPDAQVRLPGDSLRSGTEAVHLALGAFLTVAGPLDTSILDYDASERLAYCMGRYRVDLQGADASGYYMAVVRTTNRGPRIRALFFSGPGESTVTRGG